MDTYRLTNFQAKAIEYGFDSIFAADGATPTRSILEQQADDRVDGDADDALLNLDEQSIGDLSLSPSNVDGMNM